MIKIYDNLESAPLSLDELRDSGLLWKINTTLHDYGIALAAMPGIGGDVRLLLSVAPDGIYEFDRETSERCSRDFSSLVASAHDQAAQHQHKEAS